MIKNSKNYIAVPPGETIREQLEDREMTQKEFAIRMGMSEKHISHLISGKTRLEPQVSLMLENVLGIPANFWMNLESIYQEQLARVKEENYLEEEIKFAKKFPYSEMAQHGWVEPTRVIEDKVKNLRKFFEVNKLFALENLRVPGIAYRAIGESNSSDYSLAAWSQQAKLIAREYTTEPINVKEFKESISTIREFSKEKPEIWLPKLTQLLSQCGIVLVLLPHMKGSYLHGASFYDGNHIVLGVTVRGKDADKFWFSFFHESCHIIKGHISESVPTQPDQEQEADDFARDILIAPEDFDRLKKNQIITKQDIINFSNDINIHPGIVLGRLQKEGILKYSQYNDLKIRYILNV